MESSQRKRKCETEKTNQCVGASYHGMFYHLRLGMVILLHSFNLHRKKNLPVFSISMEERDAGKFDDIVIRYSSTSIPNGTIYIQAKHKLTDSSILTETDFFPKNLKNAPFAILMYFESFLDHYQSASTGAHAYLLCTNATIDNNLMEYFELKNYEPKHILSFCTKIGASCCYFKREDKFTALMQDLRNVSLGKLGKLIASHAKSGKEINSENTIFRLYNNLIVMAVESGESNKFKFNNQFWAALNSTPLGMLRIIVEREYEKLSPNTLKSHVIQLTISKTFIESATNKINTFSTEVDPIIHQFCDEFMLVCGSKNESNLLSVAHDLMPNWVGVSKDLKFENLQTLLLEKLRGDTLYSINLNFLKKKFFELNPNDNFNMIQILTQEHVSFAQKVYPDIRLQENCLRSSYLFQYLNNPSSYDVYRFRTTTNTSLSTLIVLQASELHQCQCLFVNGSSTQMKEKFCEILQDMMEFLFDVDPQACFIIVIYGHLDWTELSKMQTYSRQFGIKVILIQQLTKEDPFDDLFFVRDLTEAAQAQLLKQHDCFNVFGTCVSFNSIVKLDDTVTFLSEVLEKYQKTRDHDEEYNRKNFEHIKSWYISRSVIPYGHSEMISEPCDEKINLNYPSDVKDIPFERISFASSDTVTLLSSFISSQNDAHTLPDVLKPSKENKVHIILDDAGYGKSTFFISLVACLSVEYPSAYVFHMIALNYSTDFARLNAQDPNTMDDTTIVRILYRLLHLTLFVSNASSQSVKETDDVRGQADRIADLFIVSNGRVVIEKDKTKLSNLTVQELIELRLFEEKFNENQLVLALDGFDELAPHYKDVVMRYFARLAKFEAFLSLYISSRPYDFKADIQKTFFEPKVYQLQPFTMHDQIRFLHNYLKNELEAYQHCETSSCIKIVAIVYERIMQSINELKFIPLFLHMGARTLLPAVEEYIDFQNRTISLQIMHGIVSDQLEMITDFMEKKFQKLQISKTGLTDTISFNAAQILKNEESRKQLKRRHHLLSLYVIFDKQERATLLTSQEQQEASRYLQKLAEGNEKLGIILGARDCIPQFSHRMFAEYFAACWFLENKSRKACTLFFQSETYSKQELSRMKIFFDKMIKKESV